MAQETGTAKGFADPEVVTITIGANSQISVDKNEITLSKRKGHRATWQIRGGTRSFNIIFADSPFDGDQFDNGTANSLAPRQDAREGAYKYTVQVPGCNDLDPQVIVDP